MKEDGRGEGAVVATGLDQLQWGAEPSGLTEGALRDEDDWAVDAMGPTAAVLERVLLAGPLAGGLPPVRALPLGAWGWVMNCEEGKRGGSALGLGKLGMRSKE